ncbi:amidase [Halalkalirubrum salinum]|uniref:amidase n=1 Tax=Halalkalirubrum salinum TaxID=2563889 RepID=UPI0010FB8868|nr:amidase [Halalkalirubrum salinum]
MRTDAPLAAAIANLRDGETTPEQYTDRCFDRFSDIESDVHAFVSEADRTGWLKRQLRAIESSGSDGRPWDDRPALYGVPVGVKDIFHVDGLETHAGSSLPPEVLAGPQGCAIDALVDAGAIVFGKTVTAEFAHFSPGPTRNPHDLDRTPGGSSSGSAAAVAAGVVPLALGTQTIGSVNRPAAFCGVVGFKPSYGRIPTDGVIPAAPSVDHVGTFTQDIAGARAAAAVLCSGWRSESVPRRERPTIGVPAGPYVEQAEAVGQTAFTEHVDRLEAAGFDVTRLEVFPDIEAVNRRHERLVAAEMAMGHERWYRTYGDRYAEKTAAVIEKGRSIDAGELAQARVSRVELRERVCDQMAEADIDVIVSPAAPGPAPDGIETTGDPIMSLPWTHSGLPTVSIPASRTDEGLPIGLACSARFGDDERLLRWCEPIAAALDGV